MEKRYVPSVTIEVVDIDSFGTWDTTGMMSDLFCVRRLKGRLYVNEAIVPHESK